MASAGRCNVLRFREVKVMSPVAASDTLDSSIHFKPPAVKCKYFTGSILSSPTITAPTFVGRALAYTRQQHIRRRRRFGRRLLLTLLYQSGLHQAFFPRTLLALEEQAGLEHALWTLAGFMGLPHA